MFDDAPSIYPMCEYPKPVYQLHVVGNRWITVGFDHAKSIMPYKEYGWGSYVTWFKVDFDDGSEARINGAYVDEVQFMKEE